MHTLHSYELMDAVSLEDILGITQKEVSRGWSREIANGIEEFRIDEQRVYEVSNKGSSSQSMESSQRVKGSS